MRDERFHASSSLICWGETEPTMGVRASVQPLRAECETLSENQFAECVVRVHVLPVNGLTLELSGGCRVTFQLTATDTQPSA